jgi:hypothetical protein
VRGPSHLSPHTSNLGVDRAWWLGRSSKPRRRRLRWLRWVRFPHAPAAIVLVALAAGALPLAAQDSVFVRSDSAPPADTTPRPDTNLAAADTAPAAPADTVKVHSKPAAALWRSLLVPGWGQVRLGRKLTAGFFVLTEGITLGMALKANSDLRYLRRIGADSAAINAKSQTREDWLVLLAVNHLLAGLEAYIAANLTDFPAELKLDHGGGGFGASVTVPVRLP